MKTSYARLGFPVWGFGFRVWGFRCSGFRVREAFEAAFSRLVKIRMCVRDPFTQAPTTYALKKNEHTVLHNHDECFHMHMQIMFFGDEKKKRKEKRRKEKKRKEKKIKEKNKQKNKTKQRKRD